jgi:hypothetical protein
MSNYDAALERVLEEAGGPSRVARHLGIVASAVTQWTRVPARHVPRLEALTGIPGRDIRPDLYPASSPPDAPPAAANDAAATSKPGRKRTAAPAAAPVTPPTRTTKAAA